MIVAERTKSDNEDFRQLVEALDCEMQQRYDKEQEPFRQYNQLDSSVRVIVAYKEGKLSGCGCFRPTGIHQVAEIKRMFTLPGFRGFGIAATILDSLEQWAKEEGFLKMRLETGIKQPEAQAVYKKAGYYVIDNFDPYKDSPFSICMEKVL